MAKYRASPPSVIIGRKGGSSDVFHDVKAPGVGPVKVMNRETFERATRAANTVLAKSAAGSALSQRERADLRGKRK